VHIHMYMTHTKYVSYTYVYEIHMSTLIRDCPTQSWMIHVEQINTWPPTQYVTARPINTWPPDRPTQYVTALPNTWLPDPLKRDRPTQRSNDLCSLPSCQISENDVTYRSVLILCVLILCGRPDTPGSDPQRKIMRYCFYYLTCLGCLFPSD